MNRRTRRGMRIAALATSVSMLAAGCDFSVYDLPLPGGADTGETPYSTWCRSPRSRSTT